MNIDGVMSWSPSASDNKINLTLRMESKPNNKEVSKILENLLPGASKDYQLLWNLWDETHVISGSAPTDQKINFILLLLASGTIASSFMDPRLYQSMQYVLGALSLGKVFNFLRKR